MGERKSKREEGKTERKESREVLFEMGIIYLKIFLLKFEITGFYPFRLERKWLDLEDLWILHSALLQWVTRRCHSWPGGSHLYPGKQSRFGFSTTNALSREL